MFDAEEETIWSYVYWHLLYSLYTALQFKGTVHPKIKKRFFLFSLIVLPRLQHSGTGWHQSQGAQSIQNTFKNPENLIHLTGTRGGELGLIM